MAILPSYARRYYADNRKAFDAMELEAKRMRMTKKEWIDFKRFCVICKMEQEKKELREWIQKEDEDLDEGIGRSPEEEEVRS
jgi:hypothetical protein